MRSVSHGNKYESETLSSPLSAIARCMPYGVWYARVRRYLFKLTKLLV